MIVIGMGTGRSGTKSLAAFLNAQRQACCFHELNPYPVRFATTPRPILNTVDEFQAILDGGDPSMLTAGLPNPVIAQAYDRLCKMRDLRLIGDIALYYLPYVERIASHNPNVGFICMRRDIEQTVRSFAARITGNTWPSKILADRLSALITGMKQKTDRNPWMEHDGSVWRVDQVWDKCYPKFQAKDRIDAIRMYCRYYYAESEKLAGKLGGRFRFVDLNDLNARSVQAGILSFAGVEPSDHVYLDVHENQTS